MMKLRFKHQKFQADAAKAIVVQLSRQKSKTFIMN